LFFSSLGGLLVVVDVLEGFSVDTVGATFFSSLGGVLVVVDGLGFSTLG